MQSIEAAPFYAWQPAMNEHPIYPGPYFSYPTPDFYDCAHYPESTTPAFSFQEALVSPHLDMIDFTAGADNTSQVYPPEYYQDYLMQQPQTPPTPVLSVDTITSPSWVVTPPASVASPKPAVASKPKSRRISRRASASKVEKKPKTTTRKARANSDSTQPPSLFHCEHEGCGKTFTRPYNLTSHMRTHTLDRPFACSQCGRRFARQHDRNRHEKLHWGIKPYTCHRCLKSFARVDALGRHLKVENGCGSMNQ